MKSSSTCQISRSK